jgi:proteasome lid subunit RPN8/RPN11
MMRGVTIPSEVEAEVRLHGEEAYPEEACGFLIAPWPENAGIRSVRRSIRAPNALPEQRRKRFAIAPEFLRQTEIELDRTGEAVVGLYHTHPDHPGEPSEFDRSHAWPWYTYLVLAVRRGSSRELGAFEFTEESENFERVPLTPGPTAPSTMGRTVRKARR